jgi:serine/threonine protein phosphatase 1
LRRSEHEFIDLSARRRVFAAGDIHGSFHLLEAELAKVGYDPQQDGLVFVGDLVDRGPDSMEALKWIDREDVRRTRGNHEDIAAMVVDRSADLRWALKCGAKWLIREKDHAKQAEISRRLNDAPVALTIRTPGGYTVGVTHADCPSEWEWIVKVLSDPTDPQHNRMVETCLWSRTVIDHLIEDVQATRGYPKTQCSVTGVDHVFHGHTIVRQAFAHGDRSWIDTGATSRGVLTVVDIDQWLDLIDEKRIFA